MVAIATIIPSTSYSLGTFSIPVTALNSVLTYDINAVDSYERLLHSLLMCLYEKQLSGSVTQANCGVEISSKALTTGTWETSTNTFAESPLSSFLVTFRLTDTITEDGDTVAAV